MGVGGLLLMAAVIAVIVGIIRAHERPVVSRPFEEISRSHSSASNRQRSIGTSGGDAAEVGV